jgi:hypothetical protein
MTTTIKPKRARRFAREPMTVAPAVTPEKADGAQIDRQAPTAPVRKESKSAQVIALLQRPDGATLDELIALTGWLPHTSRAAMTGLRKKGHEIQRTVIDGVSRYTIARAS